MSDDWQLQTNKRSGRGDVLVVVVLIGQAVIVGGPVLQLEPLQKVRETQ